jgi:NAD(P)-dependent dehydrogenase (short-subunit alcohol dehydrogenase family)
MIVNWTLLLLILHNHHLSTSIVAADNIIMQPTKYYAVTGANAGLGLESVRQLASLHVHHNNNGNACSEEDAISNVTIFLLCRNPVSAQQAIDNLTSSNEYPTNVHLKYVPFDSSDRSSVNSAIETLQSAIPDGQIIEGLLLNAGGFTSDRSGTLTKSGTTMIAETNLIGHAILVNGLIQSKTLQQASRVIFSGSEAGMGEPFAIKWGNELDYYRNILNGKAYRTKKNQNKYKPQDGYGHIKGMIAFYAAAMARRHRDIYFAAVSPGSTKDTYLMDQGSFPNALKYLFKGFICLSGQHGVDVGAGRYIDALVGENGWEYKSGTFVCSKKGYIGEVCDATELKKGKPFGEEAKQDLVYEAVQSFMLK